MPCGLLHTTCDAEPLPHLGVKGRHVLVLVIPSPGCLPPHIDLGHDHIHDLQQEELVHRFKLLLESCAAEVLHPAPAAFVHRQVESHRA